jgi:DNA-binding response OmpR family regulator
MRQAQILVYESDGRLAQLLRAPAEARGWRLRELRQASPALDVLHEGGPILVLKLGRDLYEELARLEEVTWGWPETATVVVSNSDHPEQTALLWDLGAAAVLLPADPLTDVQDLVAGLMGANK